MFWYHPQFETSFCFTYLRENPLDARRHRFDCDIELIRFQDLGPVRIVSLEKRMGAQRAREEGIRVLVAVLTRIHHSANVPTR